ncbi:hypothetical protein [Halobellus sp. GM3]|uniref:hypothetical protein n=1 Tax=Halobellus sp. GM3 TaxID=3458410 RepID=UPI00403DF721
MTDHISVPRSADLPAGYDEEDPYADTDLDELPDWWQENAEHFRAYGMRPYRPPRFTDGELTTEVVDEIESETGATVEFRAVNPSPQSDWEIVVDGDVVERISRTRTGEGYSQYERPADEVRKLILSHLDADGEW